MLFPVRIRRTGLALAICLRAAIIIAMGLFSFGLVMISLVLAATGGTRWDARCADSIIAPVTLGPWPIRGVPGPGPPAVVKGAIMMRPEIAELCPAQAGDD